MEASRLPSKNGIKRTGQLLAALLIGTLGGWIFWRLHLPLAWMLGSMTACGLAALFRLPIATPAYIRPPMTAIIGVMLGCSFTPAIFGQVTQFLVPLIGLALYLLVTGGACYLYFRHVAKLDRTTAYFSGMPGGLVDMVILGAERGGDERLIALIHASRIFLVVMTVPPLVGFLTGTDLSGRQAEFRSFASLGWEGAGLLLLSAIAGIALAKLLRLPAQYLLGPMLISAALHLSGTTDFTLPTTGIAIAQIVLGTTVGCRFVGVRPKQILHVMGLSVGSTAVMLTLTCILATIVTGFSDYSFEALFLAYAPGGLAEMGLVALSIGVEVPFIIVHHLIRVFLVIAGAAAVYRLFPDPAGK